MSNIIFCFSGTGNSLAVASSVAEKLKKTEVVSLLTLREHKSIPAACERAGFVFPCSYGHPPPIVTDLVKDLRLDGNPGIFIIVTYAGRYGFALSDMKKLLQPRTGSPVQGFSVQMPGNHIVGYSAYSEARQRGLFEAARAKTVKIADSIQQNVPADIKDAGSLKRSFMDRMTGLVNRALGIKDIWQTQAAFFTTAACVHCGVCQRLCPAENIRVSSDGVAFGNRCQQCMACIQWCPQKAISHPNVPSHRSYYHHPDITLEDMLCGAHSTVDRERE